MTAHTPPTEPPSPTCRYPHEKETLLPPLMGLQVRGTSVDGGTLIVKTRLSINMASLTLEQVAGKRKKLLADMAVQMAAEVRKGRKGRTAEAAEEAARMVQERKEQMMSRATNYQIIRH